MPSASTKTVNYFSSRQASKTILHRDLAFLNFRTRTQAQAGTRTRPACSRALVLERARVRVRIDRDYEQKLRSGGGDS